MAVQASLAQLQDSFSQSAELREKKCCRQAGTWDIFMKKAAKKEVLRYRDIPWPEPPEGGDLAMEALMLPIQVQFSCKSSNSVSTDFSGSVAVTHEL